MTAKFIDPKVKSYELRSRAQQYYGTDNGLYVLNSLFNVVSPVRNPKDSINFRELLKQTPDQLDAHRNAVMYRFTGAMDIGDAEIKAENSDILIIPSGMIKGMDHTN